MYFSRKDLILKSKNLQNGVASRVFNSTVASRASRVITKLNNLNTTRVFNKLNHLNTTRVLNKISSSAAATASSTALAKGWSRGLRGLNKTSSILKTTVRTVGNEGLRRAYSTAGNPGDGKRPEGFDPSSGRELPFHRRVINAWTETPVIWYPIPIAVGAILLVVIQYRRKRRAAARAAESDSGEPQVEVDENGIEIIRLKGPWQVHILGALPLRNLSRLWGYFNSLELPIWFRPYGFRLYALVFGCNLDEIEESDLTKYRSLGEFFYRKLKDGARVVEKDAVLVSPADGRILHFGTVHGSRVEQVKGITYSLDALLGVERPDSPAPQHAQLGTMPVVDPQEFANVNGIEYSLDQLLGTGGSTTPSTPTTPNTESTPSTPIEPEDRPAKPRKHGDRIDASVIDSSSSLSETIAHDTSVALEVGMRPPLSRSSSASTISSATVKPGNALYFLVVYLAPGDYHRFHSPTSWVVEKRRHFIGELFSVSPYIARRLNNLFVLNERVALLGRWRHGFFGMVPVGATNVGSIVVNFDQALRTNESLPRRRSKPPPGTYTEALYTSASPILNGQPLLAGQEMGGFCLGSTIVLVFEAPREWEFDRRIVEGMQGGAKGVRVKVGERLGGVKEKTE